MGKVRKYRRRGVAPGEWEVYVRVELASGAISRAQPLPRLLVQGRSARLGRGSRARGSGARAARSRPRSIRRACAARTSRAPAEKPLAPTIAEFAPRFIEHATANRQKASTV